MTLGAPIDLSPEELAAAGETPAVPAQSAAPAAQDDVATESGVAPAAPAPVSAAPPPPMPEAPPDQSPKLGAPIDPLDDFSVYNAMEDAKEERGYDPADPGVAGKIWNGVKSIISDLPKAAKGFMTLGKGAVNPGGDPEAEALLIQTAGQLLGNYKNLGEGAKTAAAKTVFAANALISPEAEAEMKKLSREASWKFQREAREVNQFTSDFNKHLETIFPNALAGLSVIPVDKEAAEGTAMVLDPANFIPAGAAAKWTTSVPLRGAVRAAEATVKEAALDVARATATRESANLLVKSGLNAAERAPLFNKAVQAGKDLADAQTRQSQALKALKNVADQQKAIVDQLATQASSQPLVTRGAATAATVAGRLASATGRGLDWVAKLPEQVANKIAGASDVEARSAIADSARLAAGAVGMTPKVSAMVVKRAGQALETYGRVLSEAEGQLPFFKKLSRESEGLTRFGAGLVDQSGLGQFVVPIARAAADATRGAPITGLIGWAGSGGDSDAALSAMGGGMVFGLAGAGYGQWQRYLNGSAFRQRQLADVNRYRTTLPTDDARAHFNAMPPADQAAMATMQLAHPDLKIKHEKLGPGRPSFYYVAEDGPVAVVNLDTKDGVNAVIAHEIGHHVEEHGLRPLVERTLLGDVHLKQPGLFTLRDGAGAPVIGPDGNYQLSPEWQALKGAYNDRVQATSARSGEAMPARDDAAIAREIFAEHVADYLVGNEQGLSRDLSSNMWTKAMDGLAGSSLVSNLPGMRQVLGKLGVPLDTQKRVAGSNLFPGGLPASKQLRGMISEYHQQSARGRVPAIDDEQGGVRYTSAEVVQHPQIIDTLFDGSDDVARNKLGQALRNKDGSPRFTTPKEQLAQRAELAKDISTWLEANPPREGVDPSQSRPAGARLEVTMDEKTGRKTEGWVTPTIPTALVRELEASGKYNPVQLRHLQSVSDAIAAGKGQSALFFYQPAKGNGGKYRSLAGDWRTETPYSIFVSKAGNVLFRSISREKLVSNATNLIKSGRAAAWNNAIGPLMGDVDTYLANHAAGRPGADAIGVEKRDLINALFGIDTKVNRAANPLLESSPKSPVVIRSRRIDRTNKLSPVEEYFPNNYEMLNRNLRPEAMDPGGAGGGGPESGKWEDVQPGMPFDKVKRLIPKADDLVPGYLMKGSPETMYGRIKFLLESTPTALDADGKKILLAAPGARGGPDQLLNRAKHLAASKIPGNTAHADREFDFDKAKLVKAIPQTLGDYHAKLTHGGNDLYVRRYADGTLHMVVVDPTSGRVVNHGPVDGRLITHYSPAATMEFKGSQLVKVRMHTPKTPPGPAVTPSPD